MEVDQFRGDADQLRATSATLAQPWRLQLVGGKCSKVKTCAIGSRLEILLGKHLRRRRSDGRNCESGSPCNLAPASAGSFGPFTARSAPAPQRLGIWGFGRQINRSLRARDRRGRPERREALGLCRREAPQTVSVLWRAVRRAGGGCAVSGGASTASSDAQL